MCLHVYLGQVSNVELGFLAFMTFFIERESSLLNTSPTHLREVSIGDVYVLGALTKVFITSL